MSAHIDRPADPPMLIDEAVHRKLRGVDRADYVKAVKQYNLTSDKMWFRAARYFENGKRNENGLDTKLLKRVQRRYYELEAVLTQKQISRVSGVGVSHLSRIMCGYHTGLDDELLRDVFEKLNKVNVQQVVLAV